MLVENGKGTYTGVCSYSLDVLLLEGFTSCQSKMRCVSFSSVLYFHRYLVTNLMGADLNNIVKCQKLTDDHIQFLIYQLLRGLKVLAECKGFTVSNQNVVVMTGPLQWQYLKIFAYVVRSAQIAAIISEIIWSFF